mgnify:CR=1 FL=1
MTNELICYKQMPVWTKDKLPKMFQEKHNTKVGTWGKLTVLKGKLKFYELTEDGDIIAEHISRLKATFRLLSHKPGTELKPFLMT